jgi:DNA polymerase I-like protein with 3'-5' exonuclease and polymerase domains
MSKYVFIYYDYSQIELRLAACFSKDQRMLYLFRSGKDLHSITAAFQTGKKVEEIQKDSKERKCAKTSNFLFIYNGGPFRYRDQLREDWAITISDEEAYQHKEGFFKAYPGMRPYLDRLKQFMLKHLCVICPNGRIRRLPDLKYHEGLTPQRKQYKGAYQVELEQIKANLKPSEKFTYDRQGNKREKTIYDIASGKVRHAFNQGYNAPNQSVAASIMKRAMIELDAQGYDIKNQVHDSVCVQVLKTEAEKKHDEIKKILENIVQIDVPLVVDSKILNSFYPYDVYEK